MQMNAQIENYTGYQQEEIIQQNVKILFPKLIQDCFVAHVTKMYHKGEIKFTNDFQTFFIRKKSVLFNNNC